MGQIFTKYICRWRVDLGTIVCYPKPKLLIIIIILKKIYNLYLLGCSPRPVAHRFAHPEPNGGTPLIEQIKAMVGVKCSVAELYNLAQDCHRWRSIVAVKLSRMTGTIPTNLI